MIILPKIGKDGAEARQLVYPEYRVTVNGQEAPVRACRVSAMPFNRCWPGQQRPIEQSEPAGYVFIQADEPVEVVVQKNAGELSRAVVRPLARRIAVTEAGRQASFQLAKPGQYVFEDGLQHNVLHIFVDEPSMPPYSAKGIRWYFGPGIHAPGVMKLQSGDEMYIDPEAVVYGSIYGDHVENVHIYGGGVLDNSREERTYEHCYLKAQAGAVKFYNSRQFKIEGITIVDSACWVVRAFCCSDIKISNIKIVGQWRYNTDGIDLVNTSHVRIDHCFVRSFDDTIVLKGVDMTFPNGENGHECGRDVADIQVTECVLWCGWGRNCEIGIETGAPRYEKIRFENCDLIHNSAACLDIQNGCWADISDVAFRNLRIEIPADERDEVYQQRDDQVYDGKAGHLPYVFWADNYKFGAATGANSHFGTTHDILVENVSVVTGPSVPMSNVPFHIVSQAEKSPVSQIIFRNVTINGVKLTDLSQVHYETKGAVSGITVE